MSSLIARNGSISSSRSRLWIQALEAYSAHNGVTLKVWSRCPWVSSTATGFSRCSAITSATVGAASMPGSTITHSSPVPVATR